MTEVAATDPIITALDLPPGARLDMRVPKKTLLEQGAPTTADKRAIQDGIEEMHWIAALKPNTVAIPAFVNEGRNYSEIAVLSAMLRPEARSPRLTELIHRAIPYPVLLITLSGSHAALSVAPKRAAQNEGNKIVVERIVLADEIDPSAPSAIERSFLESLALARQPGRDLSTVYDGWLVRIEALNAARVSGHFTLTNEADRIDRRRSALEEHARLLREIAQLRARAGRAKQINQRVDLNQKIKAVEAAIDRAKRLMLGDVE
jgi:hypothetical protein